MSHQKNINTPNRFDPEDSWFSVVAGCLNMSKIADSTASNLFIHLTFSFDKEVI